MKVSLIVPDPIASRFHELATADVETGGVVLARPVQAANGDVRLLVTALREVPDEAYERREALQLLIRSEGYVPALSEAEQTGCIPIWFHTHPGALSSPKASKHDRAVDENLTDLFRLRADSEFYGALIISGSGQRLRFTGHLEDDDRRLPIDRMLEVGARWSLQWHDESPRASLPDLFDRNIRAFGGDVQRVLGDLRVAVVGCGGTGSAVAEQLVRLGVRHLRLLDPDELSESNVTRVYGSTPTDVGRPKVDVLAEHLERIAPDVAIDRAASMVTVQAAARSLIGSDVIFGCTDDNAGRLVLSRLSSYMITPVIDCGVLLSSNSAKELDGIHGRVTVLHPGAACLVCRGRIDLPRAASEALQPEERIRLADEGYAPALAGVEPAVVAFTTLVAATAVGELLERFTHYGPESVPSEVLLRVHDREVSTNVQAPIPRHYCDPEAGRLGAGMTDPFLEQTWQA